MLRQQISKSVFYVGVDDRRTQLFESLWPLPYGVSYNAYVVKGEKTALIDTVELSYLEDFLVNLREMGVDRVDYLVVNHMEPDHSGSLPEIASRFPEMKIIGNAMTARMIEGYYGLGSERMHIVADGESVDLGEGCVLSFHTIPMVHWPETMVTHVASEKVLFSGDAFGTFGALGGHVLDSQFEDLSDYFSEMRRYYACVVAKYGQQVQNALAKLKGKEIEYICSTHGPVWHEQTSKVIATYDDLSRQTLKPGVVIAYGSMYGHTAEMAQIIAKELVDNGIKAVKTIDLSTTDTSFALADIWTYSGLIVGSPTYNASVLPPVGTLLAALKLRGPKGRKVSAFGNYTWAPASCKIIEKSFEEMGLEQVAPSVLVKMNIEKEDELALKDLAREVAKSI